MTGVTMALVASKKLRRTKTILVTLQHLILSRKTRTSLLPAGKPTGVKEALSDNASKVNGNISERFICDQESNIPRNLKQRVLQEDTTESHLTKDLRISSQYPNPNHRRVTT